jgi:hypothetical protein
VERNNQPNKKSSGRKCHSVHSGDRRIDDAEFASIPRIEEQLFVRCEATLRGRLCIVFDFKEKRLPAESNEEIGNAVADRREDGDGASDLSEGDDDSPLIGIDAVSGSANAH